MEELPAGGFGLELEKFAAPDLVPPLFDEDSPEDEGSSSSTAAPNKSQSSTGSEQVVQAAGELEEKQLPLTSASFQDSNSSSISDSEAYLELNDLLDPNPPSYNDDGFIYEDSDDYFDPEELLEYLSIKSDQT